MLLRIQSKLYAINLYGGDWQTLLQPQKKDVAKLFAGTNRISPCLTHETTNDPITVFPKPKYCLRVRSNC